MFMRINKVIKVIDKVNCFVAGCYPLFWLFPMAKSLFHQTHQLFVVGYHIKFHLLAADGLEVFSGARYFC